MKRDELADLLAFVAVAEECSFTKAAARLGTSQSALSHTIRRLEKSIGVKLLERTTRSVRPTDVGSRMAQSLRPAFDDIIATVSALDEVRADHAGTVRITTSSHAAETVLWPAVARLLREYPELNVEISVDQKLVDIEMQGFDAAIRLGEEVNEGMESVRISADLRMAVVGSPAYFERHPVPDKPDDLLGHACINLWLPTRGCIYPWEFQNRERELEVLVEGPFVSDDVQLILKAALDGVGLAFVMEDRVRSHVERNTLIRVLGDWCPSFIGYHLCYPVNKRVPATLSLLADTLRYPRESADIRTF